MKHTKLILFASIFLLMISACKKEEETTPPKPDVTISELGYENSKIGYAGTDLHIEAEIVAEGNIDKVTIEIHPEGEHEKNILEFRSRKNVITMKNTQQHTGHIILKQPCSYWLFCPFMA